MKQDNNECVSCRGDTSEGRYWRTKRCDDCLKKAFKEGWTASTNGTMSFGDVTVLPGKPLTFKSKVNERTMDLISGHIDPSTLDDEEVAFGVCRNEDGSLPEQSKSGVVPKAMMDAIRGEHFQRASLQINSALLDSINVLKSMLVDPEVETSIRFKAAVWFVERILGKTPEILEVAQMQRWEVLLDGVDREQLDMVR